MRVLLATDGNLERQGICSFMLQWVEEFKSAPMLGNGVVIYFRKSIKDQEMAEAYQSLGAELFSGNIPDSGTMTRSHYRSKIAKDIRGLLSARKFDVVHINSSAKGFTVTVLREAVRAGVPIRISHSHGRNNDCFIKRIYTFLFRLYIVHRATLYAGCSVDAGLYMFGRPGINSKKWRFIPNTIDTEKYAFDEAARMLRRKELKLSQDIKLVGAVGYLEEIKNHVFLLDVILQLKKRGENTKLIVFGEGSLRELLEEKRAELGIVGSVILYGVTDQIPQWLSAMDYYVMPSLSEGVPISAVEAQANGLPCLLSDRVPVDADINADVYHLPIDKGPEPWIQMLIKLPRKSVQERKAGVDAVRQAGFDKKDTRKYIAELYAEKA